ncbi:unnamed protein product, partial [Prorocentrum cordatum]
MFCLETEMNVGLWSNAGRLLFPGITGALRAWTWSSLRRGQQSACSDDVKHPREFPIARERGIKGELARFLGHMSTPELDLVISDHLNEEFFEDMTGSEGVRPLAALAWASSTVGRQVSESRATRAKGHPPVVARGAEVTAVVLLHLLALRVSSKVGKFGGA